MSFGRLQILLWWRRPKLWTWFRNFGPMPSEGPLRGTVFVWDIQFWFVELRWKAKERAPTEQDVERLAETLEQPKRRKKQRRMVMWYPPPHPPSQDWKKRHGINPEQPFTAQLERVTRPDSFG